MRHAMIAAVCCGVLLTAMRLPATEALPQADVKRVQDYFQTCLKARYMEQNCEKTTYPGWKGLPLVKCHYTVRDKDGTEKPADVIMLNPSPEQLARWVVSACLEVKGSADAQYTDKLSRHIIQQSGAQFPVAGVVYEDMEGDGVYEAYCFRDGVTVGIEGVEYACKHPLTAEETRLSLFGKVRWTGKYARLQSTTREQYTAAGGKVDVGTSKDRKPAWLDVSRRLYREAWGKDRNELMVDWARQNL